MTKILTPTFEFIAELDDNLQISVAANTKEGDEISRTKLSEMLHPDLHSTLLNGNENITVNGQTHILTEGKMSAFWEWDSEPITEKDLDEFTEYFEDSVSETVKITRDFNNKKYKATFEYAGENSSWKPIIFKYGLKCGKQGLTLDKDESVLFFFFLLSELSEESESVL